MASQHVRPNSLTLTDADARHLLAAGLIRVCHEVGPSRVALEIGCDEKTVRRARDEESTLGLACAWNLLEVDPHSLDPLAAHFGFRLTPLEAERKPDLSLPCIVTRFQLELSIALEDGRLDPTELAKMRPAVEALGSLVDDLRERMKVRAA